MQDSLKQTVLELLYKNPFDKNTDKETRVRITSELLEEASELTKIYLDNAEKENLLSQLLQTVVMPFRKLQSLVDDNEVEEIMINSLTDVFFKKRKSDVTQKAQIKFDDYLELRNLVDKLLEGTGRKVDWSHPMVDARLPGGERINIITTPLIAKGFCITIRKFPTSAYLLGDLVGMGTLSEEMSIFLKEAVRKKLNILVVGGTASGKTTILTSLFEVLTELSRRTRVVVIEETTEIYVPKELTNVISIETKGAIYKGERAITIRDLLKNSLRMRPERIVIGELRGEEAFDFLQAANTGHPGSFTTIHANSAQDAIKRLESLVILAGFSQLPLNTIHSWIMDAIDVVVFIENMSDNVRRITNISGVTKELKTLFEYSSKKFIKDDRALEHFLNEVEKKRK